MSKITLNFFPLITDKFTVTLYRLPFVENNRPKCGDEKAVCRFLKVNSEGRNYWTLFQEIENSIKTVCEPLDNSYATIEALRLSLIETCKEKLSAEQFRVTGDFRRRVEIIINTYPEGEQIVLLEPYLLRLRRQFGFLADFRFHPKEEHRGTRKALQLSLSLDKNGKANLNYYADRYLHLVDYVRRFHNLMFPLNMPDGQKVPVSPRFIELGFKTLDVKHYVVGSDRETKSQFMGVKESGPFSQCPEDTRLYFLYRKEDHSLSRDLFLALRGDTFHTFPGMECMFGFPISSKNVRGVPLSGFSDHEIRQVRDQVVANTPTRNAVAIVLSPFSKHDATEDNIAYWKLKHAFLSEKLPIQVVAIDTISDRNNLKWSSSSIGLQIFAKAGGIPWKVRPQTENCLIVGIGQSHRWSEEKRIERFFAYSVLTDSSGVFKEVRVLGDELDEEHYIDSFSDNLRYIFDKYSREFSNFAVHSTFAIRRRELESIAEVLSEQQNKAAMGKFISLKFNDKNRFFGFAADHNSLMPYESTIVSLSYNEHLIWFEGLQFGQTTIHKMTGGPLHVKITYPPTDLSWEQQRAHLQDAINLSGANWRGFNAKSLPVSVYYAQIIARYLKEFENLGLPEVDVNLFKPWFL